MHSALTLWLQSTFHTFKTNAIILILLGLIRVIKRLTFWFWWCFLPYKVLFTEQIEHKRVLILDQFQRAQIMDAKKAASHCFHDIKQCMFYLDVFENACWWPFCSWDKARYRYGDRNGHRNGGGAAVHGHWGRDVDRHRNRYQYWLPCILIWEKRHHEESKNLMTTYHINFSSLCFLLFYFRTLYFGEKISFAHRKTGPKERELLYIYM